MRRQTLLRQADTNQHAPHCSWKKRTGTKRSPAAIDLDYITILETHVQHVSKV
jgi:hypothetical protein